MQHSDPREVLQQVDQVANLINDCVRDYDNSIKIVSVQKALDACAPKLLVPGRRFVKEGRLLKVARDDPTRTQERMFWLFSDILVYGKRNPRKKDKYFCSCVLPVRHCFIERVLGKNLFILHCKGETTILAAQTYGEVDDWCNQLQRTIGEAKVDRATLRKDSSRRLPLHRSFLSRLPRRRSSLAQRLKRRLESSSCETETTMNDSDENRGGSMWSAAAGRLCGLFKRKRHRDDESAGFSSEPDSKRSKLAVFQQRPLSTVTEEDSDEGITESPLPMKRISNDVSMEQDVISPPINFSTPIRRSNSSPPWWKKESRPKTKHVERGFCSFM